MPMCRVIVGVLLASCIAARATEPPASAPLSLDPESPPEPILDVPPLLRYGEQGSWWATLGGGGAFDGRGATDIQGFAQLSCFIVPDVELGAELGIWHFEQDGENAAGGSAAALVRWHFVNEGRVTLFLDGGVGLLGASDNVPADGTSVNFLPRAGAGMTYRPWDGPLRLMLGVRWHHISNARLSGAEDNPSRDGAMLYLGVVIPF